jgi:flagellin
MREVSVQAANDTNNSQDRANLQAEMDAMVTEIDRISSTTTWAGENLMQSGSGSNFSFQVGAATAGENQINITIDGMGAKNLGISASSAVEVQSAQVAQSAYDAAVTLSSQKATAASDASTVKAAADKTVSDLQLVYDGVAKIDGGSTREEFAGGLRDVLKGGEALASAMSGDVDATSFGSLITTMKTDAAALSTQPEKDRVNNSIALLETKVDAFLATTNDTDALAAYKGITDAYTATIGIATLDADTTTASTFATADTNTADFSAFVEDATGGGGLMTVTEAAADILTVITDITAVTTEIDAAKVVQSGANTDVVFAEGAALTAANAVPSNPADLQGVGLSVATGDSARASITTIDTAIQTVNIQRSELGAVSNRLNHTVNNLTNISSNLSAAKGGIEDADFALETTNLAKNQILQQASTAMLAQANASQQNVLALLRS